MIQQECSVEELKLLYIESYQVTEYLKSDKHGRKSKEYFKSKEVDNIEGCRAYLKNYIKFTDDKSACKLDILQQEMSNEFPQIQDLHLEDFIKWLIYHVSIVAEVNSYEKQQKWR